ncbi:Terminase small subunit (modular protein) [uncultured Sporomusa sp.]|uniref:Terminase small subunit (Modular protein) n=1 Tax=uncultured Sporomusa sp. TaxID=307249 RepID=A0A212LY34_9FIRM|nr:terminase small subunit [uncultured Sporomusa sp.]SCM82448.1 Terminase small subunit (modular protein) [uncultured Sporomusa sp.]
MTVKKDVSLVGNAELVAAKLTPQQKRFCEEYMLDLNQTAAAIRAGYSPNSANEQASRLLANVNVRAYVDIMMAERSTRVGVSSDRVIRELARLSFSNPAKVVAEDGSILDTATEDDLAAVSAIKVKKTTTKAGVTIEREVRFTDKNKSLELLARHLGMLVDKKQIDITSKIEDYTDEERIRRILELQKEAPINITPIPGDDET